MFKASHYFHPPAATKGRQSCLFVCMPGYVFQSACLLAKYLTKYSTGFNETLRKWPLDVYPGVINFWSQPHSLWLLQLSNISEHKADNNSGLVVVESHL